jgi:hypothetical protein
MRSELGRFSRLFFLISLAAVPGASGQNTSGIFLTPVANAPFTGAIVIERTIAARGGAPALNLKNIREVARDNEGRVRNVFRQAIPASQNVEPPIIRIHFYDPQTRSYAYLYPQNKTYVTGTVNHPPAAEPADLLASPAGNSIPLNQFTKLEDLGTRSIDGVSVHGVREIQNLPAAWGQAGSEVVLTDEYWYSADLHMNIVVKHDDPRTGNVTMTLIQVTRGDPDPALFRIPDEYRPAADRIGPPNPSATRLPLNAQPKAVP